MTLVERLRKEEGERLKIYDDATGKEFKKGDTLKGNLTIGVGINIMDIDQVESDFLLSHRITRATKEAWQVFGYTLFSSWSQNRQDVFIDMLFNMGYKRFVGFKNMTSAAKVDDWDRVKVEMLDSDWARGVTAQRAKDLSELI